MFNPELILDSSGVLSDEEWIMKNGISGNFRIHNLVRDMIDELDLNETCTDDIYIVMRKRLINILICIEAINRLSISDNDRRTFAECFGKMALAVGFDMMRYRAEMDNKALKMLRHEFVKKYFGAPQD